MVDSISSSNLENILSLSQLQQIDKKDKPDGPPPPMISGDGDNAQISDIGQLVHVVGSMDEQTQSDLKDFMELMQDAFAHGNYDASALASQASENLVAFAKSQGIDLEKAVSDHADFVQNHPMPPQKPNLENAVSQIFQDLDTDGDGALTQEEAGISEALLTQADQDQNGTLTQEEVLNAMPSSLGPNEASASEGSPKASGGSDSSSGGDTTESTTPIDTDGDGIADTEQVTTYNTDGEVESVTYQPISSSQGIETKAE